MSPPPSITPPCSALRTTGTEHTGRSERQRSVSDSGKEKDVPYYPTVKGPKTGRVTVSAFRGLDYTESVPEGEFSGMTNLSSEKLPVLATKPYVFALGSMAPHKNYKWIVEAAKKNPDIIFAVAGGKELTTFGTGGEIEEGNNLLYLGYISDEEAKALMINAMAFLFPSLYEGFGIPPFEAMAVGTEVIASRSLLAPYTRSEASEIALVLLSNLTY